MRCLNFCLIFEKKKNYMFPQTNQNGAFETDSIRNFYIPFLEKKNNVKVQLFWWQHEHSKQNNKFFCLCLVNFVREGVKCGGMGKQF